MVCEAGQFIELQGARKQRCDQIESASLGCGHGAVYSRFWRVPIRALNAARRSQTNTRRIMRLGRWLGYGAAW